MSNDPLTELDELSDALSAARRDIDHWRTQAKLNETNLRTAVDLANREQRKRWEAYAKLDILMAEYRRLALALAAALRQMSGYDPEGDAIETVTERLLASLQRETEKLESGGSNAGSDTVGPRLADRGA